MRKVRTEYPRGLGAREAEAELAQRPCEHPGCVAEAPFRAPRSREALSDFRWFCLAHVREYNSRWNYFAGMSPEEVERHTRSDVTWQRPTWRLGQFSAGGRVEGIHDPFELYREGGPQAPPAAPPGRIPTPEERDALSVMELDVSVSLKQIKMRYKELVKRFHPDVNQGDKGAEERLKSVIRAYNHLLTCGYS